MRPVLPGGWRSGVGGRSVAGELRPPPAKIRKRYRAFKVVRLQSRQRYPVTSAVMPNGPTGSWVFLSNHAHVLLCIAQDPMSRARDIAERVGITERAAQRIVADLIRERYITRTKVGRRNRYEIDR